MAKRKSVKRTKKTAGRTVHKTTNNNKLSILLIILAMLVFALAAMAMSQEGGNKVTTSNQVKVTASPTAKPVVKVVTPSPVVSTSPTAKPVVRTVKPVTTVKK